MLIIEHEPQINSSTRAQPVFFSSFQHIYNTPWVFQREVDQIGIKHGCGREAGLQWNNSK